MTWLLRFFGGIPWTFIAIGLLSASTATAGYLLKKSYQNNGAQSELIKQWQKANELSIETLNFEREQFTHLQQKMVELENDREKINFELSNARKALNEIPDESGCLDVDLGDKFWMHIYSDAPASAEVRTD